MGTPRRTTLIPAEPAAPRDGPCVVINDLDWAGHDAMPALRGERGRPRLLYLERDLYLMSPADPHERLCPRLGDPVKVLATGTRLPGKSARSTTFRTHRLRLCCEGFPSCRS